MCFSPAVSSSCPGTPPRLRVCNTDNSRSSWQSSPAVEIQGATFTWVRGELLGRGSLGSVWKSLNRQTGELMAVKEVVLDSRDESDDKLRTDIQNEVGLY